MNKVFFLVLVIVCFSCKEKKFETIEKPVTSEVKKNSFEEKFENHDTAIYIKSGWIRDPYIYLAEDDFYYLTGTTPQPNNPREAKEKYNTGLDNAEITGHKETSIVGYSIRVWRSENLKDWEYLGEPFTLDQGYWKTIYPGAFENDDKDDWRVWAPELYFHEGKWMFVHTTPKPVKGGANLAITVGDNMNSGAFTFPMGKDIRHKHDPSLFKDDDGTWYLLWGNTSIAPIKSGFSGLAAKPQRIDPSDRVIGHEGATVRKIGDKYVHFGTAWSTDKMRKGSYNLYYATSDKITGPYGSRKFAGRFLGHGTPFQDKAGRWWCTAFYNSNIPPISDENIQNTDLGDNAQTINEQGTTIVPLEVKILEDGDIFIRAKDPRYRNPGPDEATSYQKV